jgi:hypothetical protein
MSSFKKHSDFWLVGAEIILGVIISVVSFGQCKELAVLITVIYTSTLVLKNSLYFALKYIDLDKEHILLEKIDNKINLDNIMQSYNNISYELKPYAEKKLKEFSDYISILTEEQRTGELDKVEYYNSMYRYIDKTREKDNMWALSTGLDSEWDTSDSFEARLMQKFKEADQRGVKTNRIYIFKNDCKFKTDSNDSRSYHNLDLLLPYLSKNEYPNTTSYAIGKSVYDKLTKQQKDLMGNGFCAFYYADDSVKNVLVRDSCIDLGQDNKEISGEILFDDIEIQKIKKLFNELTNVKVLLKEFVLKNANDNAKVYLQSKGIEQSNKKNEMP